MKRLHKKITSEEFDKKFDLSEDMIPHLDMSKARINRQTQRINIDFPNIFLAKIDEEADKIGVARTALIKIWIAEKLGYA